MEENPFFSAEQTQVAPHQAAMVLEAIKQEAHEMAEQQAELMTIGVLRTGDNEHLWNNSDKTISVERRKQAGEVTDAELAEAKGRINGSYVAVTPGAAKRCIDGSTLQGYEDTNPENYSRGLGPQVQGGTADEALGMRLTEGFGEDTDATLLTDIDRAADEHSGGFVPGDHTDDHNDGQLDNTGCGAINGMKARLEMLGDDEAAALTESLANSILSLRDLKPTEGQFDSIRTHAAEVLARPNYLPAHVKDTLDKIRELNPNGVEKLVRPHNECFLILNFVEGTTFHRDYFNTATGAKIQAFNLDAWYVIQEYGQDGYALVLDAVLTYLNLTDGSQEVLARLPQTKEDVALAA
ncbi:MAG: hypothetical protein ACREGB_01815 [Candidatus Saccharimonadales bacterium]